MNLNKFILFSVLSFASSFTCFASDQDPTSSASRKILPKTQMPNTAHFVANPFIMYQYPTPVPTRVSMPILPVLVQPAPLYPILPVFAQPAQQKSTAVTPQSQSIVHKKKDEKLNAHEFKKVFQSLDLDKLNHAYQALCQDMQHTPDFERLKTLAMEVIHEQRMIEKIVAFNILSEIANPKEKNALFQEINGLKRKIPNVSGEDIAAFCGRNNALHQQLSGIAFTYKENIDCARLMVEDILIQRGNPYISFSLKDLLTKEEFEELSVAIHAIASHDE